MELKEAIDNALAEIASIAFPPGGWYRNEVEAYIGQGCQTSITILNKWLSQVKKDET